MRSVGITGVNGLIGWHVRCHLHSQGVPEALPCDRDTFDSQDALDAFVRSCDTIIHCAGMNRGDSTLVEKTNEQLATQLVEACKRTKRTPHLIYTNSTHSTRDTPYGVSKRRAAEIFRQWADNGGGRFTDLVLPHVFGEHGRPHYNSVVSTFCYQLATGEEPTVHSDSELELLHAQEVAEACANALRDNVDDQRRLRGERISVVALLAKLRAMSTEYRDQRIPDLRDDLSLRLFNTFRSYLYPDHYPVPIALHTDSRGALFEAVKTEGGGQTFMSTTRPDVTRGNHYHLRKVERFVVVRGEAVIRLRRLYNSEIHEFRVSGDRPCYVDIPVMHTHQIRNVGTTELVTLFWAHEIFNPAHPDTTPEVV